MTPPPPSEPIRPIGPLAGGVYVDRATLADRITRRRRRPRDEQASDDRPGREEDADEQAPPGTHGPIRDPRAYDDHGRRPVDVADQDDVPHVDATA